MRRCNPSTGSPGPHPSERANPADDESGIVDQSAATVPGPWVSGEDPGVPPTEVVSAPLGDPAIHICMDASA